MSYLVLARKYRPQRFDELVGQEHVARTLSNAIAQNRVHHAFLFTGARGVGKTSAARILAKALCCAEGPTANPCGKCDFCQEIVAGRSVDVMEIDGASNTGVDDVRTLREGARYMPSKGKRKIYIIDEVHMLSTSAFNALLKTLEEPPPHVVFIFATTEAHKIPTTILSRCQRYDFKLIPTARLVAHLEGILAAEKITFEPDGLRLLGRQAAGSVRDGLSLLDQVIAYVGDAAISRDVVSEVLGVADRSLLVDLARAVVARDVATTLRRLAAAVERGLDLGQLARAFLGLLRDIEVVARVGGPSGGGGAGDLGDLVDATPDEIEELRGLAAAAQARGDSVGSDLVAVLFDRWARAVDEAGKVTHPRLILEMAAVDLCQSEPLEPLGDLLERLEALEGRLQSGGAPPPGEGGRGPGRGTGTAPASPGPTRERGGATAAPASPSPVRSPSPSPASLSPLVPTPSAPAIGLGRPPWSAIPDVPPDIEVRPASFGLGAASSFAPPPPIVGTASGESGSAGNTAARGPLAATSPLEAWRRVKTEFETRRPRLGVLLANASILEIDGAKLVLGFADRADAEATEKARADIEQALGAEVGGTIR